VALKKFNVGKCKQEVSIQWQGLEGIGRYCKSEVWADSLSVGETVQRDTWRKGALLSKSQYVWSQKGVSTEVRQAELEHHYRMYHYFAGTVIFMLAVLCFQYFRLAFLPTVFVVSIIAFMKHSSI
jgi:hypothetical protein